MPEETIKIIQKSDKKRLGKGLSALLGAMNDVDMFSSPSSQSNENFEVGEGENIKNSGFILISTGLLRVNILQPRKVFLENELEELSNSIARNGILQPLLVRKLPNDMYEIIAGERRFRAAKMAGLQEVPCIIKDLNDEEVFILAIIENIQRENLNPLEEGESYAKLIKQYGYKQEDVANLVNKSRSHISNLIRITNLPNQIKQMVIEGKLTSGHVRPLLALQTEEQMFNIADVTFQNNYTVRKVEELVQMILNEEEKIESTPQKQKIILPEKPAIPFVSRVIDLLKSTFTHQDIKIKAKKKGGVISINYKTDEELELIIKALEPKKEEKNDDFIFHI